MRFILKTTLLVLFFAACLYATGNADAGQDPKSGECYSLSILDLNSYKKSVEAAGGLNPKIKEYMIRDADRVHAQIGMR